MASGTITKTGREKLVLEAKLLDDKGLHTKNVKEVNALEMMSRAEGSVQALAASVEEFIRAQTQATARREESDNRRWAELERKLETRLTRENDFRAPSSNNFSAPNSNNFSARQAQVHQIPKINDTKQNRPNRTWRKRLEKPCFNCGDMYHLTEDCKGDCKVKCFLCGEVGHYSSALKFHGPKNE